MTQVTMGINRRATPAPSWGAPTLLLHRDEQGVSGSPGSAAGVLAVLNRRHRQSHRLPPMQSWPPMGSLSATNLMVEIVEHVYSLIEVRAPGYEADYGFGLVNAQTVFLLDAEGSRLPPREALDTLKDEIPAGCVAELGWSIPNLVWQGRLARGVVGDFGPEARDYAAYVVELERELTDRSPLHEPDYVQIRDKYRRVRRDFERFALMSPREQLILERSRR